MMNAGSRILKIGIFYDGNYFYHVSNYYCYSHVRRSRLSIPGLHSFIKSMVAEKEGLSERFCQIVDCHYFRGRLPAKEAYARQILLNERIFDDILMREGVVTHYLPTSGGTEKGVDVALALETLELTLLKNYNVVVLIASDGDYVPLIRKLNALGTRVMVLGWDFEYTDYNGNSRFTTTSPKLLSEASYPVFMQNIINEKNGKLSEKVDALFVSDLQNTFFERENMVIPATESSSEKTDGIHEKTVENMQQNEFCGILEKDEKEFPANEWNPYSLSSPENVSGQNRMVLQGKILQLKNGYGFIAPDNQDQCSKESKNLFFFWEDVENCDFNDLCSGDAVSYTEGKNQRGECAKNIHCRKFSHG